MAKRKSKDITHKLLISGSFKWMIPYLSCAWKMGIPVHKLKSIEAYSIEPKKIERTFGSLHFVPGGRKIRMLDLFQVYKNTGKRGLFKCIGYVDHKKNHKFEQTLQTLAHELSHLVHYNHTPDRFILELKILQKFSKLAKRLGYKGYK